MSVTRSKKSHCQYSVRYTCCGDTVNTSTSAVPIIIDAKIRDHKEIAAFTVYCYGDIPRGSDKHTHPSHCPACGTPVPTKAAIMVLEGLDDSEPNCHHADAGGPRPDDGMSDAEDIPF